MQLGSIKALYTDSLDAQYSKREAENIFYEVLYTLEKKSRTAVLLGQETLLVDTYTEILNELRAGKPMQYVLTSAPFYGLDFFVDERVLIPRPETEQLVHWMITDLPNYAGKVLDIGTGSGCIPLTLKKHWKNANIAACDVSDEALQVAAVNKDTLGMDIHFFKLDILKEEIENYDILVSNPPYISDSEKSSMRKNVLDYEPHLSLFVEDEDPLLFYKRIIHLASKQKATCYLETSENYRLELDDWLSKNNFLAEWKLDFQAKNRMLKVSF